MDPHDREPQRSERDYFEELAHLRREQQKLRDTASSGVQDARRSERLRQIDVESAAAWTGIRSARAASRAAHRARFAPPRPDPFRAMVPKKSE